MFIANPLMWIVMIILYLVIAIVLSLIPLVGSLALMLIVPLLFAGFMLTARHADQGEPVEIGDLFAAFGDTERRGPLLMLGVLLLVVGIVAGVVLMGTVMGTVGIAAMSAGGDPAAAAPQLGAGGALAILLILAVGLLAYAAFAYAIPLVYFDKEEPVAAIKASVSGSIKNIVPLLIAGVIYIVLAVIATIPFGLGWLVLAPVAIAAVYASYKEIFGTAQA